jgi:regulator of replication initiation timing
VKSQYPPIAELKDFVGQVDVLLQENEGLRRENADLRRRVAELTPYAELAREMHDTLHADRG